MVTIYNFYDTETTGLSVGDKVISIGMMIVKRDGDELAVLDAIELFNMVDVPITAGAENAHGISPAILLEKSGGKRPEDNLEQIMESFELSNITYAYNKSFDRNKIIHTYGFNPEESRPKEDNKDLMLELSKVFGKRVSQEVALNYYLQEANKTTEQFDEEFERDTVGTNAKHSAHNALYDAYCLARLYAMAYGLVWKNDAK